MMQKTGRFIDYWVGSCEEGWKGSCHHCCHNDQYS